MIFKPDHGTCKKTAINEDGALFLRYIFPGFERLTENRQEALRKIYYTLGPTRLKNFCVFVEGINSGDFAKAEKNLDGLQWFCNKYKAADIRSLIRGG